MKLERLAHVCMVTLAIASVANIGKWLHGTGENAVTAWGVAGATGAIVVTLAVILSKVDRNRDPAMFWLMLVAVLAMCALSGTLQFFAYSLHMAAWKAALLGYLLPLAGEALVGLSMSMYDTYRRGEMLHNADDLADQQVAEQIAAAMGDLDLSKSKGYIQAQVDKLARQKIDATVSRLMSDSGMEPAPEVAEMPKSDTKSPKVDAELTGLDKANQTRRQAKLDAMDSMLDIYRADPDASLRDVGQQIDRSPETVRGYLKEMETDGRVYVNGSVQVLG